jgi:hypothetical protein
VCTTLRACYITPHSGVISQISATPIFPKFHGKHSFPCTASLGNEHVSENTFISLVSRAGSVPYSRSFSQALRRERVMYGVRGGGLFREKANLASVALDKLGLSTPHFGENCLARNLKKFHPKEGLYNRLLHEFYSPIFPSISWRAISICSGVARSSPTTSYAPP